MTWFRVDDSFPSHPKVRSITRASRLTTIGLWTACGSWSAHHLTDGLIPADTVLDEGGRPALAVALVKARLWHAPGDRCDHPVTECPGPPPDGHYQFHDWFVYNPSRAEVMGEREAAAERMKRVRAAKKSASGSGDVQANVRANARRTFGGSSADVRVTPSRPVPSPQTPLLTLVSRRLFGDARTTTTDADVELWREVAGNSVLEDELKAWLLHNAGTDLRDPGAALLGWLRIAAQRAGTTPPGCDQCIRGWAPDEFGQPSERRCTACRPHLRSVEAS